MKKILLLSVLVILIMNDICFSQGAAGFVPRSEISNFPKRRKFKNHRSYLNYQHEDSSAVSWSGRDMEYRGADYEEFDTVIAEAYNSQREAATPRVTEEIKQSPFSLTTLLSFNFTGKDNNISNLAPEVFLGWSESVAKIGEWDIQARVGPYFSSQLKVSDSSKYLPAFMTSGNVGIVAYSFVTRKSGNIKYFLSPVNLGMKLMSGFNDSTKTIIQHFYMIGAGVIFKDLVSLTVNYSIGWHNLTSQSEENFRSIFIRNIPAHYVNVCIQTKLNVLDNKAPLYLFVAWRGFLNTKDYNFPNSRILSVGMQKDFDFTRR